MQKFNIYSQYLNCEKEVTAETMNNGEIMLTHESLTAIFDAVQVEHGIKCVLSEPYFVGDRIIYHCRMTDKSGKDVTEVGESCPNTLNTQIGRDYAASMASKRAFDAALIRFLQLDLPKVSAAPTQESRPVETSAPAVSEPENVPEEIPAQTISSQEIPVNPEEETLEFIPEATVGTPVSAPETPQAASEPVSDTASISAVNDPVLGFGKHKGKKLSEVIQIDRGWVDWALAKLDPNTPEKRSFLEAAKAMTGA